MKANCRVRIAATLAVGILAWAPTSARAQQAPLSHVADASVYKVIGENEQFRVVLATWKPQQRDLTHSHPATVVYYLTSCTVQTFGPDGTPRLGGPIGEGTVFLQDPIPAHAFQNVGSKNCQVLIVERK